MLTRAIEIACKAVIAAMFLGGVMSCLLAFASGIGWPSSTLRWPLGTAWDIVVDNRQGNVYVFTGYGRIQAYDANGYFIRGWSVGKPGVLLQWDKTGRTIVAIRQGRSTIKFDPDGRILQEWMDQGEYQRLCDIRRCGNTLYQNTFTDDAGNVYQGEGAIWPVVGRTSPNGERTIVVKDPVWLWLFNIPYPGFVFVLVPLIPWTLSRWRKKMRASRASMPVRQQ